jgi:ATP-dependent RNA helicase RhlE
LKEPTIQFSQMNLIRPLLRAVDEVGYTTPTPIQAQTIPLALKGRDVIGCAQTGTGKTAAFALPILQNLLGQKNTGKIRALILTPTRELALQNDECFTQYGKYTPLRNGVLFGGVGQTPQVEMLQRGVDILVATPGRLNDLIGQGYVHLDGITIFVLDEADRMLDMGFIHDVKRVISHLPAKRQTLLFSATMPPEIESLADSLLIDPATVKVDPVTSTVDAIEQSLYYVNKGNKKLLLAELLHDPAVRSALVFTRTKHGADKVVRELEHAGITAMAIHGNKSQTARQKALSAFKSGEIRVLIATDIAARGIDIFELSHVVNYDLPHEPETYIHRIGRTARAGHDGIAISFCCFDEMEDLKSIEKLTGNTIPVKESPWPMEVFEKTVKQPRPPRAVKTVSAHVASGSQVRPQPARHSAAKSAFKPAGTESGNSAHRRHRGGVRHHKSAQK